MTKTKTDVNNLASKFFLNLPSLLLSNLQPANAPILVGLMTIAFASLQKFNKIMRVKYHQIPIYVSLLGGVLPESNSFAPSLQPFKRPLGYKKDYVSLTTPSALRIDEVSISTPWSQLRMSTLEQKNTASWDEPDVEDDDEFEEEEEDEDDSSKLTFGSLISSDNEAIPENENENGGNSDWSSDDDSKKESIDYDSEMEYEC